MNRSEIDELYHLLRVASNSKPDNMQAFSDQHLIYGLARHLLAGGDYLALIQFSACYGEKFLVEPASIAIAQRGWKFDRIVEFGSGLQWLGRGLAAKFSYLPTLFIDKRQWVLTDIVADLETDKGVRKVKDALRPSDLIVMADLLHCLDDPKVVISSFKEWPMAILEYIPSNPMYAHSFEEQLKRYHGGPSITPDRMAEYLSPRPFRMIPLTDTYELFLVEGG